MVIMNNAPTLQSRRQIPFPLRLDHTGDEHISTLEILDDYANSNEMDESVLIHEEDMKPSLSCYSPCYVTNRKHSQLKDEPHMSSWPCVRQGSNLTLRNKHSDTNTIVYSTISVPLEALHHDDKALVNYNREYADQSECKLSSPTMEPRAPLPVRLRSLTVNSNPQKIGLLPCHLIPSNNISNRRTVSNPQTARPTSLNLTPLHSQISIRPTLLRAPHTAPYMTGVTRYHAQPIVNSAVDSPRTLQFPITPTKSVFESDSELTDDGRSTVLKKADQRKFRNKSRSKWKRQWSWSSVNNDNNNNHVDGYHSENKNNNIECIPLSDINTNIIQPSINNNNNNNKSRQRSASTTVWQKAFVNCYKP